MDKIKNLSQNQILTMKTKILGIIFIVLGFAMMVYTGIDLIRTEKVIEVGSISVNKEKEYPVRWSPIIGLVLIIAGGVIVIAVNKKNV